MFNITTRIPDIDWSKGFDRHWCGGSPTMTHWFNAISFLLPTGEKFFRDVAREVAQGLNLSKHPNLEQEVRKFAIQESLHADQHRRYNAVLAAQGFANVADPMLLWWEAWLHKHLSPLTNLAIVCAYEHYTAILAEYLLSDTKKWMKSAPDMALFWGWHAAEETEHKAVCFDLYKAAGGGWLRRAAMYLIISIGFNFVLFGRAYSYLIRTDGCLRSGQMANTMASKPARRALLGPIGIALSSALHYLSPRFHPWQRDNRAQMEAWLRDNASRLRVVARATDSPAQTATS